jgi:hypothetical protein
MPSTIEACTRRSAIITSLLVEDRLEDPGVGVHAGRKEQGVLGTEEGGELALELAVDVLGAADEAHRRHPVPTVVEALVGRGNHLGVARQAEVVVRAQVDDRGRFGARGKLDLDVRVLQGVDEALLLEQAGVANPGELSVVPVTSRLRKSHCHLLVATAHRAAVS